MKFLHWSLIGTIGIFIFSGCSRTNLYSITYNSSPEGASVICNGISKGYTPVSLEYDLDTRDEDLKKTESLRTQLCSAKWISGITKNYSQTWDLKKFPNGVMQTLQRPDGEGYEKDAQFALQVQQMKVQQAQARAIQHAADDARWNNINQSIQNTNQNLQIQQLNNSILNRQLNNNLRNNGGWKGF